MNDYQQQDALIPIKERLHATESAVAAFSVRSSADVSAAATMRSSIKKVQKDIEAKKKEITAPLLLAIKNVRALFAPLEGKCETLWREIDAKVIAYTKEIEERRQKEELRIVGRLGRGTMKEETAIQKLEALPDAERRVATDTGSLTIRKIRKFRIVDASKIPLEYMVPDEVKIRKAMFDDIAIEGVEYYVEDSISGT